MDNLTPDQQHVNRQKLADILEQVPLNQFEMRDFIVNNECGTVACALGHAAISGQFEGLSFTGIEKMDPWTLKPITMMVPTVNGDCQDWDQVGEAFFGEQANNQVFFGLHYVKGRQGKARVIQELREIE